MANSNTKGFFKIFKPGSKGTTFGLCFIIAAVIWFLNTMSKNYTSVFNIVFENPLKGEDDPVIHATMTGRGFDLMKLHYRFSGVHNLIELKYGRLSSREMVTSLMGNLKSSIQLVSVDPVFITSDQTGLFHKRVPVKSRIEITFKKQTALASPVLLQPDSIDISGTTSDIASIKFIETASMKLLNIDKPVFSSIMLESPDKKIFLSQKKVWMYVPVEKYTEGLLEIPLRILNKGQINERLLPEKVKVTYRVPVSKYNLVNSNQFQAGVFVNSANSGKKISVKLLEKPSFVNQVTLTPSEVTYLIFD